MCIRDSFTTLSTQSSQYSYNTVYFICSYKLPFFYILFTLNIYTIKTQNSFLSLSLTFTTGFLFVLLSLLQSNFLNLYYLEFYLFFCESYITHVNVCSTDMHLSLIHIQMCIRDRYHTGGQIQSSIVHSEHNHDCYRYHMHYKFHFKSFLSMCSNSFCSRHPITDFSCPQLSYEVHCFHVFLVSINQHILFLYSGQRSPAIFDKWANHFKSFISNLSFKQVEN